jgi:hypothetical protein
MASMERRKHRRFQQWNKAIITSVSGGEGVLPSCPIDAYAWDLSLGGSRIQSEECFPVGAIVRIHLDLVRSRESVSIDGIVRWSRRNEKENINEFGVEFQESNQIALQAIMKNLYHETGRKPRAAQPQVSLGKGAM